MRACPSACAAAPTRELRAALIAAALLAAWPAAACKCNPAGRFVDVAKATPLVVVGQVRAHQEADKPRVALWMTVDVKRTMRGRAGSEPLRIYGDDGKSCRPYVRRFAPGSRWVFALRKDHGGRWFLSICGEHWLKVEGDKAVSERDKTSVPLDDLARKVAD